MHSFTGTWESEREREREREREGANCTLYFMKSPEYTNSLMRLPASVILIRENANMYCT
jgi:hypothetical protein